MIKLKHIAIACFLMLIVMGTVKQTRAQVFYIGFNAGAIYTWFNTPGIDNLVTANGWGHDLGFFLRYGKRPYFQAGFDWIRTKNEITVHSEEFSDKQDNIPFHIFDFSFKVGYEIVQLPMFKLKAHAGPFIGRSILLSKDDYTFEKTDFKNPQYGIIAGIGFQFTNLVVDFEYTYHVDDLWKPLEVGSTTYHFNSNLQVIAIKVGIMF